MTEKADAPPSQKFNAPRLQARAMPISNSRNDCSLLLDQAINLSSCIRSPTFADMAFASRKGKCANEYASLCYLQRKHALPDTCVRSVGLLVGLHEHDQRYVGPSGEDIRKLTHASNIMHAEAAQWTMGGWAFDADGLRVIAFSGGHSQKRGRPEKGRGDMRPINREGSPQ